MPYYGDTLPYYYGGAFSTHSSLMTGTGRTLHSPLGSTRYAPHLTTISESPLSALRRYTPSATMTSRPKRIIDTADIDVSTPRPLSHSRGNEQRCHLRRDRPTIRIRSQALKDNPALREHYERHEKTVGELLVEKFLIKDKKCDTEENESRTKLYSQISLDKNMTKKQKEDIQRRLTRRMTRRRSSADVQMDPEQVEREVLFAQAQADALDSLVAEEQAEIEVEVRMGTLLRKNLVRSVPPLSRSGLDVPGLSGDDTDEARTKKLAKKVKKRKKTSDKPSPPSESELDSEHEAKIQKIPSTNHKESDGTSVVTDEKIASSEMNKKSEILIKKDGDENEGERSPTRGLKFKIEASNSHGDLSTLWINANVAGEQDKQRIVSQPVVEQFRDSVRLPAPKHIANKIIKNNKNDAIIEEHQQIVVLPVKKLYVKDDTRNSVYLTLKTQKNANPKKDTEKSGKIDRINGIDDRIDQSTSSSASNIISGKSMDFDKSKKINSITDNTTMIIARQPKLNKVAKFRSKDITESDVEVKSISELSGPARTEGKIGTKDASSLKSSSSNDDTSNIITKESISESTDRDANGDSTSSAIDKLFAITSAIPKDENTNLVTATIRDNDEKLENKYSKPPISLTSVNVDKIDRVSSEIKILEKPRESGFLEKIETPLKRLKKETKEAPEKKFAICENRRILKRNATSSLDTLSNRINVENLDDRKNKKEEKEDSNKTLTESNITKILSAVTTSSNNVESLPNASTINLTNVENGFNGALLNQKEKLDVKGIENSETTTVENLIVDENLSLLSAEIATKFVESPSEISKPIGVINETSEVDSLGNSHKDENECQNVVAQPTVTIESPKIQAPTIKDVNLQESVNTDKLVTKLTKKISPKLDNKIKDDKNVIELSKLRKNRKLLPFTSRKNSEEIVEFSSAESPNFEINVNASDKSLSKPKKRAIASKDDKKIVLSPKSKKSLNYRSKEKVESEIGIESSELENSLEKIESLGIGLETVNQTNGFSDTRLKTVGPIGESAKAEVKLTKRLESSLAKKEEEIDFWGEIKSEKIDERKIKSSEKIVSPSFEPVDNFVSDNTKTEKIEGSMVIVLEPETKSNTLPESGTREETKPLVPVEKKLNKVKKKKKTSEISGCKKKDEEKASSETILEPLKSSEDSVDEKSHKKSEQLETPSEKLGEKNSPSLSEDIKIIGIEIEPDIERFERNLSTILEESQSPITEDIPKIEALDLVTLSLKKEKESSTTREESSLITSQLSCEASERNEKILTKNLPPSVRTSVVEPEVPVASKDAIESDVSVESEKEASSLVRLSNSDLSVPTISIALVKLTEEEEKKEKPEGVLPEEVLENEDETEDGPGTPTNETVDEEPNNITKWQGLDDLSLDQPDKDIGPEVALANLLKRSKKKKAGSSKKTSKKNSVDKNSTKSTSGSQDSSKKKKLGKKKKSTTKSAKDDKNNDERSGSKVSNSSDTTLKPGGLNLTYTPKNSGRNSPKQRPLDLIKMFYTTPASLLTATPRDLSKVRRAKVKKRKHSSRTASASSDSTGSTRSTQSTGTIESTGSTDREEDPAQKRISSTRSNDSGFDGSPRLSNCDMACHKKCEKLTGNLCGLNQKLVAEALQALKRAPSQSSDNQRNSDGSDHHASGRITPPATNLPRFKKYTVMDFNFLKVLGKGSFGKVLLAELRRTDCVYAVKCLKKDVVLEDDDVECTLIERKVLTLATRHPYLCHLFCTFQTDSHLFFVMEYLNGGDLMFHIQKSGRFAESRARFYAAEIWSGLNFLHKKGIVYRDLKLDNVLLDFEGHIRIADFGMCKLQIFLDRTADTFCGTPDYMAPEIIKGLKYNQAVDWWSFGVLLYEMLTGQSPFSGCDEDELFWSICNERPFIPRYLSQEAMDVLICLLEKDAGKRPPAHEISIHPFFHSLAWDRLERRQLEPPFKPALEHTLDTRYFDTAFTAERPRLTPVPEQILTSMDQGVFRGFSYTNPNATD